MRSRCNDERLSGMIHAYELDLLTERDREEFELHLYKCQSCFEEVRRLRRAAAILRVDPEVDGVLAGDRDNNASSPPDWRRHFKPERMRRYVAPLAVVASLLVVLIFTPWRLRVESTDVAVGSTNSIVVMDLQTVGNGSTDPFLGRMISSLIVTNLAESHFLEIVSRQRTADIFGYMGEESPVVTDRVAMEVARRAHARWMLVGEAVDIDREEHVVCELIEVSTGKIVHTYRLERKHDETVFDLADRLSKRIRRDLIPNHALVDERDVSVADITTRSQEAYRLYLEGTENRDGFRYDEARDCFKRAIAADSSFAIAYFQLSLLSDSEAAVDYIELAVKYIDKATTPDRFLIKSRVTRLAGETGRAIEILLEAADRYPGMLAIQRLLDVLYYEERDYASALKHIRKCLEIDSLSRVCYNQLAYAHAGLGHRDSAMAAIDKYISLAPNEPNPYDSRGHLCQGWGDLDCAAESFSEALKRDPSYARSLMGLATVSIYRRDYGCADSCIRIMRESGSPDLGAAAWHYRSIVAASRGMLSKSLAILDPDSVLSAGGAGGSPLRAFVNHPVILRSRANIQAELGNYRAAVRECQRAIIDADGSANQLRSTVVTCARIMAESGQIEQAEQIIERYKSTLVTSPADSASYWYARGCVLLQGGTVDSACELFRAADSVKPQFVVEYMYAKALMVAGDSIRALTVLLKAADRYDGSRVGMPLWSVKTHYYLGVLREQLGMTNEAVADYETFLEVWRDADPGILEVSDARSRLDRLKGDS